LYGIIEQRLYIISLFVLLQAWKLYDLILSSSSLSSLKHSILDVVFLLGLPYLRIPKLEYDQKTKYSAAAVVCFLNWLAFGGWRLVSSSPHRYRRA
jgi:nucleoporin POM152